MHVAPLCLALVSVVLGCKGDEPAPPPPSAPKVDAPLAPEPLPAPDASAAADDAAAPEMAVPAIKIDGTAPKDLPDDRKVYCFGAIAGGDFHATENGVPVHVTGPEGTRVAIGVADVTLGKDGGDMTLDLLGPALRKSSRDYGMLDDKILLSVTTIDAKGATASSELECTAGPVLVLALSRVRSGPVRWPNESEVRYTNDVLAVVGHWGGVGLHGHDGARLYDADFIAVERKVDRKFPDCHYDVIDSAGKKTGESLTKPRFASDLEVTVYNRRTGAKISGRTVKAPAPPSCPEFIPVGDSAGSTIFESVDLESFYAGIVKPRPEDGPDEYGVPSSSPALEAPAGAGVPETQLPSVAVLDKRFMSLPLKEKQALYREDDNDGSKNTSLSAMEGETYVNFDAHDWAPSAKADPAPAYVIGPRFAIKASSYPANLAEEALKVLIAKPPATYQDCLAVMAGLGYKVDSPANVDPDDGVQNWGNVFKKGDDSLFLDYYDWAQVADGKSKNAALARSKTSFVYVKADTAEQASLLLGKVVHK